MTAHAATEAAGEGQPLLGQLMPNLHAVLVVVTGSHSELSPETAKSVLGGWKVLGNDVGKCVCGGGGVSVLGCVVVCVCGGGGVESFRGGCGFVKRVATGGSFKLTATAACQPLLRLSL
jgi:hypothetical protein